MTEPVFKFAPRGSQLKKGFCEQLLNNLVVDVVYT